MKLINTKVMRNKIEQLILRLSESVFGIIIMGIVALIVLNIIFIGLTA